MAVNDDCSAWQPLTVCILNDSHTCTCIALQRLCLVLVLHCNYNAPAVYPYQQSWRYLILQPTPSLSLLPTRFTLPTLLPLPGF